MKGYKGTDKNMQCRGMQFEVGKEYEVEGKPELCRNGIHFCKSLSDVFEYYPPEGKNRFFEVEADDDSTIIGDNKCVTSRIKIVRELLPMEINRGRYGNGYGNGDGYGNGYGDGYGKTLNNILIWR